MAPKVLVVLTSFGHIEAAGKPTGWYLPELAHPYDELIAAGAEITTASPKGGEAPLDPGSVAAFEKDESSVRFLNNKKSVWQQTAKLETFLGRANEFDALFYPGGHGPMFDLATDPQSQQLIAEFVAAGKTVAAVCHGPCVFVNVKLADGTALCQSKEVTGFSNAEEDAVAMSKYMPFMLETALGKVGAKYVKAAEPWGEKVVVDGKLITGQNPASAKAVGQAIVKALAA